MAVESFESTCNGCGAWRSCQALKSSSSMQSIVACDSYIACRQAIEERLDALSHEMQSLDEDRSLLKQYRDTDTVVARAGVGAQVERARLEQVHQSALLDVALH